MSFGHNSKKELPLVANGSYVNFGNPAFRGCRMVLGGKSPVSSKKEDAGTPTYQFVERTPEQNAELLKHLSTQVKERFLDKHMSTCKR